MIPPLPRTDFLISNASKHKYLPTQDLTSVPLTGYIPHAPQHPQFQGKLGKGNLFSFYNGERLTCLLDSCGKKQPQQRKVAQLPYI